MSVAIRTGVSPTDWIDDPRALITAIHLIAEQDRRQARQRRRK